MKTISVSGATPISTLTSMIDGFDDCLEDRKSDMIVTDTAVTDPRRVGDGIKAFTTFSVTATRALPREPSTTATVTRRFSDFYWYFRRFLRILTIYIGYINVLHAHILGT